MPIGDILISKGIITPEQLKKALEVQSTNPNKKSGI